MKIDLNKLNFGFGIVLAMIGLDNMNSDPMGGFFIFVIGALAILSSCLKDKE